MGGALEARQINASDGKLSAEVTGEIGLEGKILVIRRIRVHYKVRAPEEQRAVIERVHGFHADHCGVARSVRGSIQIETSFELVD